MVRRRREREEWWPGAFVVVSTERSRGGRVSRFRISQLECLGPGPGVIGVGGWWPEVGDLMKEMMGMWALDGLVCI